MRTRWQRVAVFSLGAAVFGLSAVGASAHATPAGVQMRAPSALHTLARITHLADLTGESAVTPGTLDDGADLLPQAAISIDQAIAAAQAAAPGQIGEIDLEHYHGALVFNVDVGDSDVKVDAATGQVLGSGTD